jgi:hypothetical protein
MSNTTVTATAVQSRTVSNKLVVRTPKLEPTPYLEKIMRKAEADIKAGKNIGPPLNKKQALEYLQSLI